MSLQRVFPNLRRMHEYGNLPLRKQLSFLFPCFFPILLKRNTSMGTWEHIKFGGNSPRHNTLGFFCWERSLKKIHIEIKRELFKGHFMPFKIILKV